MERTLGCEGRDESSATVRRPLETLRAGIQKAGDVEFLGWAARHLAAVLEADLVSIGELVDSGERVCSLVFLRDGEERRGLVYDLAGTPCARVAATEHCHVARGVNVLFPEDRMLADFEGYAGIALRDRSGGTLGLIAAARRTPMDDPRTIDLLRSLRNPIARHVESVRAMRELSKLVECDAPGVDDPFAPLARRLARALHVRAVQVCGVEPDTEERADVLALCVDGGSRPAGPARLGGTPCGDVHPDDELRALGDLAARYPGCPLCRELRARSFYGRVLRERSGAVLGHVGVVHDGELPPDLCERPIFRGFVARVTAELNRARAERRRAEVERDLVAEQRMESLGALAGGIAHDFNNVLVGVLGGASLAQRDLPRDSAARRHLDVLIASAERGSELVREILACAGKAPLEKAPAAPGALVRADLLAADLRDRVRLRCRVAEGLPSVAVDRALLWRALAHLVRNGAESYGDAGGTVSARALLVEVGAEALARAVVGRELAPGSYVCLEVADRAAGMPAPTLARAFDPYFTTKPSARGLGLTAVRGIVAGHDGALLVESTPGKGTVARVLLPPAAATPDPPGAESERGLDALQGRFDAPERRFDAPQRRFNAPQRYGRALIADDESTVRAVVAEMLAEVGFEVLEATDGVEAVELARANPDLSVALLDVTMPRLDGAGAQRILRVDRPDLPVLLMSGFTRVDEAALRGAAGFLRKPFRLSDLARELERVLPASASRSW